MGGEISKVSTQTDKEKMDRFLDQYDVMNENLFNVLDASLYKKKNVIPSTTGHISAVLMKRYVFKFEDESSRFLEVLKMRKSMSVHNLPKLYDFFMRVDNGYCQVFYTYHVAFEFINFNLEKELALRSRNTDSSKVAYCYIVLYGKRNLVHTSLLS